MTGDDAVIMVGVNRAAGELEQAATKNADTSKTNFIVSQICVNFIVVDGKKKEASQKALLECVYPVLALSNECDGLHLRCNAFYTNFAFGQLSPPPSF